MDKVSLYKAGYEAALEKLARDPDFNAPTLADVRSDLYDIHKPSIWDYRKQSEKVYPVPVNENKSKFLKNTTAALGIGSGLLGMAGLTTLPLFPMESLKVMGTAGVLGAGAYGAHKLNNIIHPDPPDTHKKERDTLNAAIDADIEAQLDSRTKFIYNHPTYRKYMFNKANDSYDNYDNLYNSDDGYKLMTQNFIKQRVKTAANEFLSKLASLEKEARRYGWTSAKRPVMRRRLNDQLHNIKPVRNDSLEASSQRLFDANAAKEGLYQVAPHLRNERTDTYMDWLNNSVKDFKAERRRVGGDNASYNQIMSDATKDAKRGVAQMVQDAKPFNFNAMY